ncbi:MAG TPA: DegV family protein [Anaerolineales bacterium]|jgi:DegV family protein with EDD domain
MAKVRIVADSSARPPNPELWDHPLLTPAPVHIRANGIEDVEDPRRTLGSYRSLLANASVPLAEPASVDTMVQIYGQLFEQSDQILSLHPAQSVSRGWANARQASDLFRGRCDIQVIDSQSLSAGLGLLVEAAVLAAEQDEPLEEIVRLVRGMIPRMYLVFFLDDLLHLERYGLITASQAILGNMLGVIAFLTMEDGRLIPMEKVRSRPRALEKLVEFVAEFTDLEHIAVLQPSERKADDGRWVAERLAGLHPATPITFADYGPAVATLVGQQSVGVIVLEAEDDLP